MVAVQPVTPVAKESCPGRGHHGATGIADSYRASGLLLSPAIGQGLPDPARFAVPSGQQCHHQGRLAAAGQICGL